MKCDVDVYDQFDAGLQLDAAGVCKIVQTVWRAESKKQALIAVILTDDADIMTLNSRFLNRDTNTDVIAFCLNDEEGLFEGEIYINLQQVRRNADTYGVSPDNELHRVVIHGTLHFLGYDDATAAQKKKMTAREDYYLKAPVQ